MTRPNGLTLASFGALALLLGACSSSTSSPDGASAGSGGTAGAQGGATAGAGASAPGGTGAIAGAPSGGAPSIGGAMGAGASAGSGGSAGASDNGSAGVAGSTGSGGGLSGGAFTLTSPDFTNGSAIPLAATCATSNPKPAMPALMWTRVPVGTKSFAITFLDDTRLPSPQGEHYAIYDIPADVTSIAQGLPSGSPPMGIANLVGAIQKSPLAAQYLGPCPNNTDGTSDSYAFTLYALSQEKLPGTVTDVASIVLAIKAANPLGQAVLTGTSDAKGTLR